MMKQKLMLIGFDNKVLSDSLYGLDINKGKYIHNTKTNIYLREYVYYFTQLYQNNGVFFDGLFESIEKGLNFNDNTMNAEKTRESGVMDCYPALIHRVNNLLKELRGCLIISNTHNNRYDYLIDLLDVKPIYLGSELDAINYIKEIRKRSI